MPIPFLIPAITAGLSALGGARGNRNSQNTESTRETTGTSTGSSVFDRNFENVTTSGFNPQFAGEASDALQGIFARFGPNTLNPEDLRTQELVERERVNRLADRFFGQQLGGAFSRGLGASGAGGGLARGMAEMFRGSGLLDVAGNFAQRRFELPALQERINSSQRSGLAQVLSLLPRTSTQTGVSSGTQTNESTTNQTSTGTSNTTGRSGGGLAGAIGGALGGFGVAGGFDNIPGFRDFLGQTPNQPDRFNFPGQTRFEGPGQTALDNTGFQVPTIPQTPAFNPNVSGSFTNAFRQPQYQF